MQVVLHIGISRNVSLSHQSTHVTYNTAD